MNVTLRQVQAFLHIARLENFTRAAEALYVTQAGLSLMVKELESQVGVRLFDRTTRSVQLTEAGNALLPVAHRLLADWTAAVADINNLAATARHELRVAATPLVAASIFPRWLIAFTEQQRNVHVRVTDVDRSRILQLVESGEVDLGLGAFFKPVVGLERRVLASFELVRIAPAARGRDRGKMGRPIPWSDLEAEHLLGLPTRNPIQQLVDQHLRSADVAHTRGDVFESILTLVEMVEAGHGAAILPSFVLPACSRYAVHVQKLVDPGVPVEFYVVRKKGRDPTPLSNAFVEAFAAHLGSIGSN